MINPINRPLPDKDVEYIKNKIMNRVRVELMSRILKGYEGIDLSLIEGLTDRALKNSKISN